MKNTAKSTTSDWRMTEVACDNTHHILHGEPLYSERFDEVLKFHAPGLAPVRRAEQAWHICPEGQPAYARRFLRTFGFYEGLAAVIDSDGWHHIRPDGSNLSGARYTWCGNFQGGRCPVREASGRYYHIHSRGLPAYTERWRYAGDFRDGIAVVQADNGHSSHIDTDGRLIHGRWFLDLDVFHKGFARARDEAGWLHVDPTGSPLYLERFAAVEPFYNGQARVERLDGGLVVIDETGETVVELRPSRRSEFAALSRDMVGFWRTQTISAAVKLGVIEALPGSVTDISKRCGLPSERAKRLLRALGELSIVFLKEARWHLTERGEFLRVEHPLTLAGAALEYAGPFSHKWASLADALSGEGEWAPPDIFEEVSRDERRRDLHHCMLRSYARHDYPDVAGALELYGHERVVDAGGGLGTLANLLLDAHLEIQVTVLDRPEVVAHAARTQAQRDRLEWRASDLFTPWGIQADVVVLSRILHDWDDAAALRILRHARTALPPGGRLFIVELVLPEAGVAGALCDLHLLVATGGKERTTIEYRGLLEASGFELRAVRTLAALPSVLMGVAR